MSDKMTCPGCDSRTSGVLAAVREGDPCPYCGLSADAISEVEAARESRATAEMRADYEAAILRADRAEREAMRLRRIVGTIKDALGEDDS